MVFDFHGYSPPWNFENFELLINGLSLYQSSQVSFFTWIIYHFEEDFLMSIQQPLAPLPVNFIFQGP